MTFLRQTCAAAMLCLAFAGPAFADDPVGAEDARATIQSQLDAFQAEAVEDAYQFAAPNIQQLFPTPRVFGQMVKRGYPMVWNPRTAEFLGAKKRGESIVQRLRFIDQNGGSHIAEYIMVLVDSEWRIAGVSITRDTTFGV